MVREKIAGHVVVKRLAPNLVKLTAPTWFQNGNLEKGLADFSKTNKIKSVVRVYRSMYPVYFLVVLEK